LQWLFFLCFLLNLFQALDPYIN